MELDPEKVRYYYERGLKFIYQQQEDEWKNHVCSRLSDRMHTHDLDNALDIMDMLKQKRPIQQIVEVIKYLEESDYSYSKIMNTILYYSKRGPELIRIYYKEIPNSLKNELIKVEQRNKMFEQDKEYKNSFGY
jgi:hypothetical protein